jgi:hypothetical protein
MSNITPCVISCTDGEEHVVRRLGKAVVAQWDHLPQAIRDRLMEQAVCMQDREGDVQVREQILTFILKHQGAPG